MRISKRKLMAEIAFLEDEIEWLKERKQSVKENMHRYATISAEIDADERRIAELTAKLEKEGGQK